MDHLRVCYSIQGSSDNNWDARTCPSEAPFPEMNSLANAMHLSARTLRYLWQVRRVAPSPSDAFVVSFEERNKEPTLEDFHLAFLFSPVFQTELWLLRIFGVAATESVSHERLRRVGTARNDQFALWRTILRRQDGKTIMIESTKCDNYDAVNNIVVMRCSTPSNIPFCETWWSIEKNNHKVSSLQFGTAMLGSYSSSWIVMALDPLHQLYSRLLLASAKETLERRMLD